MEYTGFMRRVAGVIGAVVLVAVLATVPCVVKGAQPEDPGKPQPFSRLVEVDDGGRISLEIVARTFTHPDGDRPTVTLVGAVHIADQPFYDALQDLLERKNVVLFEGVKPPGAGLDEHDGERSMRTLTRRRLEFLASAVDAYRAEHQGRVPESLEVAADALPARVGALVRQSIRDPWGAKIVYETIETPDEGDPPYRLISYGADGLPGGEGPDADVMFEGKPGPVRAQRDDGGIQARLARALGLVFQKDGMDWDRPHWRNSDLSIDQVMDRLEAEGAAGGPLFSMLDGTSFMARLGGFMLSLVERSPTTQAMLKVMLIEMLGGSEDVMAIMDTQGELMRVLIDERNKVVIEDLRRIIADEPGVETVGVIYGAGHLPDLELRLERDLGYRPTEDSWHTAITVDLADAGIPRAQARQMREMMRRSMETQLRRSR